MTTNPFKILFFFERVLTKIETFLLSTTFILLLVISCIQLVLRKFFTAWFWADEFDQNMVVWVGFLGAVLAVKENRHLTTEILTNFLSKESRARPIIALFVNLFTLVVCGIFTYVAWRFCNYRLTFEGGDELLPGLPKAYFSVIFPLGFGLIFVHYLVRLFEIFYNFAGGDKAYPQTSCDSDVDISINIKVH
jgi:TRAP-type C4-dicarboxylate transport system permease small subunit